ncbi:hypothetical protein MBOU_41990 [Mycobacterium bourgelatii]|uniref:Uncharacterized protein n=1 Tax=Mycobacterium bourgelatii TaxID=1273442 RepID=A0A7I9YUA8_MYCBU|nr:hypothetical protein MBOU_41990 [Mycobacterium bourgelatii]
MRKTFWDNNHPCIVLNQFLCVPVQERWRARSQIHCDIPDPAAQAADHFQFRMRRVLKVQATHYAGATGSRLVDLLDLTLAEQALKFLSAEEADERAARIADR